MKSTDTPAFFNSFVEVRVLLCSESGKVRMVGGQDKEKPGEARRAGNAGKRMRFHAFCVAVPVGVRIGACRCTDTSCARQKNKMKFCTQKNSLFHLAVIFHKDF